MDKDQADDSGREIDAALERAVGAALGEVAAAENAPTVDRSLTTSLKTPNQQGAWRPVDRDVS